MNEPEQIDLEDRCLAAEYVSRQSEAAFRALYRRHTTALYRVVLRLMGGNVADAEDVVQETWLRAARGLRAFAWRSSLRTWLTGIAINCARNRYRQRAAEVARAGGEVTEMPSAEPLSRVIDEMEMQRAVERLPESYREVLLLHDVEGHTHTEIAEILGIAVGTSKSQLSRARSTLRRWLGETGEDHERRSL
jgi:RNA polymerase sigma-70 factor (ECF subfamily)